MNQCKHCEGFVPVTVVVCPHCDAKVESGAVSEKRRPMARWKRGLMAAAGAGAAMFTLMACYGAPATPCQPVDKDGDGYFACAPGTGYYENNPQRDCDDNDPKIHPGATDTKGDGIDQNCDGEDGVATNVTNP